MIFNFRQLISRHKSEEVSTIIETDGYYDYANGGKYIEGKTVRVPLAIAAVIPIPKDEIKRSDGGYYSADAKKLYTYTGLDKGCKVDHRGNLYKITGEQDYSEHDKDLHIYYLERVRSDERDSKN